ncbi:MAG: DnaA ATPase domain-containing protein, partial [Cellulomonadaceae bacterium]
MSSKDENVAAVWASALSELEASPDMTPRQLAFIRLAKPLGMIDDTVILAVGNDWTRDYLESRMRTELTGALSSAAGRDVRPAITVDPELDVTTLEAVARPEAVTPEPTERPAPTPPTKGQRRNTETRGFEPSTLNANYIFEKFVIGASNRFAHAAAVAVAEAPAKAYNPLFIYGGSGLGKTHLLHAIGHYARSLYPHVRVRYVNSEEFTNDFINSIGEGKAGTFQRRYREVDVLLIDDIQFLQGKEQTMEEFFHTFNALHNANKQVV